MFSFSLNFIRRNHDRNAIVVHLTAIVKELNDHYYYTTSLLNGPSWWTFITFKHCACAQVFICFVFD